MLRPETIWSNVGLQMASEAEWVEVTIEDNSNKLVELKVDL